MKSEWQRVHEMSERQLEAYAALHQVDMTREFQHLTHAADYVCEQLGLASPEELANHPGTDLDRLAKAYQGRHSCSYSEALAAVSRINPDAADQAFPKRSGS